jgi:Na+-translocating ferredoxin:NAD+ oxidoreductase RnfG subunit
MVSVITATISAISAIIVALISQKTNKKVEKIDSIKASFNNQISDLRSDFKEQLNNIRLENDKTFLTNFLSDLENGVPKSDIQIKRAYEVYEEYIKLNGNSYIHNKWEELVKKGVL